MILSLARFFINNRKLTLILVLLAFVSGIASYFMLPKQYNPDIQVPAFSVEVEAKGLSAPEVHEFVVSPMEHKLKELKGLDTLQGFSRQGFGSVLVNFHVWVDKEKAKTRIHDKLLSEISQKPQGVWDPQIFAIDPDNLPQLTLAFTPKESVVKEEWDNAYIKLRHAAFMARDVLANTPGATLMDIRGGYQNNLVVELDTKAMQSRDVSPTTVHRLLSQNLTTQPSGMLKTSQGQRLFVNVDGRIHTVNELNNLLIQKQGDSRIYLQDIASVSQGVGQMDHYESYATKDGEWKPAVFLSVGKQPDANSVDVVQNLRDRLPSVRKALPNTIQVHAIQDEGQTAANATGMLMKSLMTSVLIVIVVLSVALGVRNAMNAAIAIPLTFFSVFTLSLIAGENINRITLFALILVLGMLVDDSTVVVENINRHLKTRLQDGRDKMQAILDAIKEVKNGVILSTITRLFAFGSMFFVTGMMGEYMGPIPKFALMAFVISTLVALTVNPWISYMFAKDAGKAGAQKIRKTPGKLIEKIHLISRYRSVLDYFIGDGKQKRRKMFKRVFWLLLILVVITPIITEVFKARMLPKSNQDQIYIWIDAPREYTAQKTQDISQKLSDIVLSPQQYGGDANLAMAKEVSSSVGSVPPLDFANIFRGSLMRNGENQLSMRVNLLPKGDANRTLSSEDYVIKARPFIRSALLQHYPDINIRLLEDPPGPPVQATALFKIKSENTNLGASKAQFARDVQGVLQSFGKSQSMVDMYNTLGTSLQELHFDVDHEAARTANISAEQITKTLGIMLEQVKVSTLTLPGAKELSHLVLKASPNDTQNLRFFDEFELQNPQGQYVPLQSLVHKKNQSVHPSIYTDKQSKTIYIYSEMGENSLVYPMFQLYYQILFQDALADTYALTDFDFYGMHFVGKTDGIKYHLEFGGEWELTMDTFRDLGLAMMISLFTVYLLMVAVYRSFAIGGIIMITFLLGFFGVFPGFGLLQVLTGTYFSATAMIGVIALAGIVVGNAIIFIDYLHELKSRGYTLHGALIQTGAVRFTPIMLSSITTILGATTILGDPVWSGLAWAIIWGLLLSSILTLLVIPIFYYDSQKQNWEE